MPYNLAQVFFKKLFVPEAGAELQKARDLGFSPVASDVEPTRRGGLSAVVYPPLTAAEMNEACRFEADAYPPLVTISSWRWLLGTPPLAMYILVGAPFIVAFLIKFAQGSSTVSMIATAFRYLSVMGTWVVEQVKCATKVN